MGLVNYWKRRAWHRDAEAIAALKGTRPAVLITGGSDGIGLELARAFASAERTIVLIARNPEKLAKARAGLQSDVSQSNAILTLSQDITASEAPAIIRELLKQNDLFADILINSAGIGTTGDFAADPVDKLTAITDINVTALTRLCREFLPDMLTRGRGGLINVSSLGGFSPGPYQAAYYASKSYVISLTRAIAQETRGQGVRIATVAPGPVNTEFHARADGETSLYRYILPAMSPEQIAASTHRGYSLGLSVIIPGLFNNVMAIAMRVLPAMLVSPVVAILLKPRPPTG
jgi:uncharacterized protein